MKKYSLLESNNNSKFISDFKKILLDIFNKELSIK